MKTRIELQHVHVDMLGYKLYKDEYRSLHREDGPAIEFENGSLPSYFWHGIPVNKVQHERLRKLYGRQKNENQNS